jgi:hypothetical protein
MFSLQRGAVDEAVAELRKTAELSGNVPLMLRWLGMALARSGQGAEAETLMARLSETSQVAYVPPSCFAWIHLELGDVDDAFTWMDGVIEARDPMIMPIKSFPFPDPLRNDPRFHALLHKMNLEV